MLSRLLNPKRHVAGPTQIAFSTENELPRSPAQAGSPLRSDKLRGINSCPPSFWRACPPIFVSYDIIFGGLKRASKKDV